MVDTNAAFGRRSRFKKYLVSALEPSFAVMRRMMVDTWMTISSEYVGATMRAFALGCAAFALSTSASAGPIADQFAAGVGGISWGMTLDELIGVRPGGEQFFSTAPGDRGYAVADDAPLYGLPRPDMRMQYHLGKDNRVSAIAFGVPYERREQLLAELLLLFGQYQKPVVSGTALLYIWPVDGRLRVAVRASREPKNGILEFWVGIKERGNAE